MPTKSQLETSLEQANSKIASLEKQVSSFDESTPKEKKPKVKRAPGAYALFVKAEFAGMKTANPDNSAPEIMKLISVKWKEQKAAAAAAASN